MRNKDGSVFVCSKAEVGIKISHLLFLLKRQSDKEAATKVKAAQVKKEAA